MSYTKRNYIGAPGYGPHTALATRKRMAYERTCGLGGFHCFDVRSKFQVHGGLKEGAPLRDLVQPQ